LNSRHIEFPQIEVPIRHPTQVTLSAEFVSLVSLIVGRDSDRSEADLQSQIAEFLRRGQFGLDQNKVKLESPAPDKKRIDIEIGQTVIEVKKDLRSIKIKKEAVVQLEDYVLKRADYLGANYVGILTDGVQWECFRIDRNRHLELVANLHFEKNTDVEDFARELQTWLGTVLATEEQVLPKSEVVEERLGALSPSFALDMATLRDLWAEAKTSQEVQLKRKLWGRLLSTALVSGFKDSTELFLAHTYLVTIANVISHEVLGISTRGISPTELVSGQRFTDAGVIGAIEADFFSWITISENGHDFVRDIIRRVNKFAWHGADHDVLKHLYESVIDQGTRKSLGEYYTPDWLAIEIVMQCVDQPLKQRVMDPSCGSGTFLFHAIRLFLREAAKAGWSNKETLKELTNHVFGLDLHPVSTALARTTYLLAIGPDRLRDSRDVISIPVYLGDSMQWQIDEGLLVAAGSGITVDVDDEAGLFQEQLIFPESVMTNPAKFDALIQDLQNRATSRKRSSKIPEIFSVIKALGLNTQDSNTLTETFTLMCTLHDNYRNHIWGYYIRNLVRPIWFSKEDSKVDVLIGNPPWLSYRFMSTSMQSMFKARSTTYGLWVGGKHATQQDLSGFFIVKCSDQFLKLGGKIGFVVPNGTLSREVYEPFRTGRFNRLALDLTKSWDLSGVSPDIFPMPSAVVFGSKIDPMSDVTAAMPSEVTMWKGKIPQGLVDEDDSAKFLERIDSETHAMSGNDLYLSPYKDRFAQGTTIVPSVLFRVEEVHKPGDLGNPQGLVSVKSKRSNLEKEPWKSVNSFEGNVESKFVFDMFTSSSILPFRSLTAEKTIMPVQDGKVLSPTNPQIEIWPNFAKWWIGANETWKDLRGSQKMELEERINYQNTLINQFPLPERRIVYTTSGTNLTAAVVESERSIIESNLYWAACPNLIEADYLSAILNSNVANDGVKPMQARGNFGPRHFHLHIWKLPFPEFIPENDLHLKISGLGKSARESVAELDLPLEKGHVALRKLVNQHLIDSGIQGQIDLEVEKLLKLEQMVGQTPQG